MKMSFIWPVTDMKLRTNVKIIFFSFFMFILGALLLFNVLLINVKGIHLNSGTDLNEYDGISFVRDEMIPASRGRIYDSNGYVLAQDTEAWDIVAYISPDRPGNKIGIYYVDDPAATAKTLAEILGASEKELYSLLTQDRFLTYLGVKGRGITTEVKEQIEALELHGIEFVRTRRRYYPYTPFASNLIGFAKFDFETGVNDIVGASGVEASLDEYLSGTPGKQSYYRDTTGNSIVGQQVEYVSAQDGNDVYLTINRNIQTALQKALTDSAKVGTKVTKAWGIIMEAKTGKIVGYDNYPTYDQNKMNVKDYVDYNAMSSYEPGSVMKTFTYAAVIDSNPKFKLTNTFNSGPFLVGYDKKGEIVRLTSRTSNYIMTVQNFRGFTYGKVDYWYGFSQSLNVATATLLQKYITRARFGQYLDAFGFFKPVGVKGIPYEAEGVRNLTYPAEAVTTTYGQGSAVTALQMVQGYSAFANEGQMVKPYLVDRIVDSSTGEIVYQGQTEYAGQPVSAETAVTILELMKYTGNPKNKATGRNYAIDGIEIGIKTGTAETVDSKGVYGNACIHSAVVFLPADDPQLIVYLCYQDSDMYFSANQKVWRTLLSTCADVYNLYKRPDSSGTVTPTPAKRTVYENGMPALVNHSSAYVKKQISSYGLKSVRIGSGQTVLAQYPEAGTTVISGQRVLLLMGNTGIKMPDMTGWSRSEVTAFWEMTGIEITMEGSGYVVSQNIKSGEKIDTSAQIILKLE